MYLAIEAKAQRNKGMMIDSKAKTTKPKGNRGGR